MGRIHLLEDDVINKIAAGEVVERPASVVKELVENALDAGATNIEISLELGGVRSIVVTDDGQGMSAEDAQAALRRHATSKIRAADDLFNINTMGFRGEALASIAAVSRFSLATVPVGASDGVKVQPGAGAAASEGLTQLPWSGPVGTTIAVENLFFNMPVRAKFLKAPATEFSHCLELIQALALCHPEVGFRVQHNGREYLRVAALPVTTTADAPGPLGAWQGEARLAARARAVLGKDAGQLQYVRTSGRFGQLEALLTPPGVEKATGKYMFTFVNGRLVKDKVMRYGVLRGYHSHLLKGRFPLAVVHLRTDPALVDVNVHPAKTDVRFQYPEETQSLIALAIREQLRSATWAAPQSGAPAASHTATAPAAVAGRGADAQAAGSAGAGMHQPPTDFAGPSAAPGGMAGGAEDDADAVGSLPRAPRDHAAPDHALAPAHRGGGGVGQGLPLPRREAGFGVPGTAGLGFAAASRSVALPRAAGRHAAAVSGSTTTTRSFGGEGSEADRARAAARAHGAGTGVADKAGLEALLAGLDDADRGGAARPDWDETPGPTPQEEPDGDMAAEPAEHRRSGASAAERLPGASFAPAWRWDELTFLGAFERCYLLFAGGGQLLAVDQHAFHERILYERLVADVGLLQQSQRLLVPESVELRPVQISQLLTRQEALAARGFAFAHDGPTTISVLAVPSLLAGRDLGRLFADLARDFHEVDADDEAAEPIDSNAEMARLILASAACHAAVRAGEELQDNELRQLLREAGSVDFVHNCPHGRRVFRWWSRAQVAAWFDR